MYPCEDAYGDAYIFLYHKEQKMTSKQGSRIDVLITNQCTTVSDEVVCIPTLYTVLMNCLKHVQNEV